MRGLSPDEYQVLRLAASAPTQGLNRLCTPEEERIVELLIAHGRAGLEPSGMVRGARRVILTSSGREAMRLHEALSACGAS